MHECSPATFTVGHLLQGLIRSPCGQADYGREGCSLIPVVSQSLPASWRDGCSRPSGVPCLRFHVSGLGAVRSRPGRLSLHLLIPLIVLVKPCSGPVCFSPAWLQDLTPIVHKGGNRPMPTIVSRRFRSRLDRCCYRLPVPDPGDVKGVVRPIKGIINLATEQRSSQKEKARTHKDHSGGSHVTFLRSIPRSAPEEPKRHCHQPKVASQNGRLRFLQVLIFELVIMEPTTGVEPVTY